MNIYPNYEMFPHSFISIQKECKDRHDKNKNIKMAYLKNAHYIDPKETIHNIKRQLKVKKDQCIEVFQFLVANGFNPEYDYRKELNTIEETYNSKEYVFK